MKKILDKIMIGTSEYMDNLRGQVLRFAQFPAPALITGETGTGKELVARGLHYCGHLEGQPFICVNCSTFSDELFASEIFGHKKGAFTGATQDKNGLISDCGKGTLFLDEIDSLSLKSQAALLRLLQEGEYRPVGSSQTFRSRVRIIAATNTDLQAQINAEKFRSDLFYRLNILHVQLQPLRHRKQDIATLIPHFLSRLNKQYNLGEKSIDPQYLYQWLEYAWPGNIRELENTLHREYLSCDQQLLEINPLYIAHMQTQNQSSMVEPEEWNFGLAKQKAVERFESEFVQKILIKANGSITEGAKLCGKERSALGKLVKKYNIQRFNPTANSDIQDNESISASGM